jgi:hypothetical protein
MSSKTDLKTSRNTVDDIVNYNLRNAIGLPNKSDKKIIKNTVNNDNNNASWYSLEYWCVGPRH